MAGMYSNWMDLKALGVKEAESKGLLPDGMIPLITFSKWGDVMKANEVFQKAGRSMIIERGCCCSVTNLCPTLCSHWIPCPSLFPEFAQTLAHQLVMPSIISSSV